MKVSVLLAVYNGECYLHKSIQSVLSQTHKDLEILIGFNGTTDRSKEIAESFKDDRLRIFDYGSDKGKPKTLNKLLKESKGDWIAIQDDDDMWLPEKLEKQAQFIHAFDVIGTQIKYVNERDEEIGGVVLDMDDREIKKKSRRGDNQIANSSAIIRRSCLEKVNGWRENLNALEDMDLWLRLMNNKCKFVNLNSVQVLHRLHSRSNFNTQNHDPASFLNLKDYSRGGKILKGLKKLTRFFKVS